MSIVQQLACRLCEGKLEQVFSLGEIYISDFVEKEEELRKLPLNLVECKNCGLVQIEITPDLDTMYRKYWYQSGINNTMVRDLEDIVSNIEKRIELFDDSIVCDIGCNDGTLLSLYKKDVTRIGFDPALSVAENAKEVCNYFINDYFRKESWPEGLGKAKVITAIAMFYDLEHPHEFVEDLYDKLDDDGIIVIQFTDLLSTLKINAIDNLCFEHIELYKLVDIIRLFRKHNMDVFDVEYNNVNGGSLRVYISKYKYPINPVVYQKVWEEHKFLRTEGFDNLSERINLFKEDIVSYLNILKTNGKRVCALGASTKGNTLLQVFELGPELIESVGEINSTKFGLKTVTGIPIKSEKQVLDSDPYLVIILPWHFTKTFMKVTKKYIDRGGKVLYPLPIPILIFKKDGKYEAEFI